MPTKSLRCCVELNIRAVSCPGVWLHSREDVYVRFTLFGQIRTTRRVSPIFPLLFCETFQFDKVFYGAHAPSQVADDLLCENIQIELLQDSLTSACGRRLAVYIRNAADFLYPESSGLPRCCGCKDRDILMERSFDFPGISPKLEFSTTTTIKEAYSPYNDADLWRSGRSTRKSRSTSRKV
ncbi:Spermatogenesis associated 6-like protein [Lamellibrachia satsuma]|nr:Spermatogenesis associated 6-like protein [Lamellibrachia satsuma]